MTAHRLYLFGPPRLEVDGQEVPIRPRRAFALFIHIAATRQSHGRDVLASLLWPESSQESARASLRRTLHRLNQTPAGELVRASPEVIEIAAGADLWLDVEEFRRQIGGSGQSAPTVERLERAAALYADDFLAGFSLPDCPEYSDWQFFQREELRHALGRVLEQLAHQYETRGNLRAALSHGRRWLALDPLHEEAHRRLMLLYARDGRQAAAIRQFRECERILQQELNARPSEETRALYDEVCIAQISTKPAPKVEEAEVGTSQSLPRSRIAAPSPIVAGSLPPQPGVFVGRQQERGHIRRLLTQEQDCRLLTIVGPGGIGKTRLALEIAHELAGQAADTMPFRDGILFVHLASLQDPAEIFNAIAGSAFLPVITGVAREEQLLEHLRERQMLIVLDNFEHLRDGAPLLLRILAEAPCVKLLVTSLQGLNLREEWFFPLGGMSFPSARHTVRQTGYYEAVDLFEMMARHASKEFSAEDERTHVIRICQLVEGMPLALELAASWLKVLTAADVAAEIERGIDILSARYQDIPPRHRSIRAVLEHTWTILSDTERDALLRLAPFRGGFDKDVAQSVSGLSLATLASLADKALIRVDEDGRYQTHELLRHFAAEKLAQAPEVESSARERHSSHYLSMVAQLQDSFFTQDQCRAFQELRADYENIRLAWEWAATHGQWHLLERVAPSFWRIHMMLGRCAEGQEIYTRTLAHLECCAGGCSAEATRQEIYTRTLAHLESGRLQTEGSSTSLLTLRGTLLHQRGIMRYYLSDFAAAVQDFKSSEQIGLEVNSREGVAQSVSMQGVVLGWQGQIAKAHDYLWRSHDLFDELNDRSGIADVQQELTRINIYMGRFHEAKTLISQSLEISRRIGRPDWIAHALSRLGWTEFCLGEYELAEGNLEHSYSMFSDTGHVVGTAHAVGGLAWNLWAQGPAHFDRAQELGQASLEIFRTIGHRLQTSHRLGTMSAIASSRGDYARAEAYASEGLSIAEAIDSPSFAIMNRCCLAEAAYAQGRCEAAETYLLEALRASAERELWPRVNLALYHLGAMRVTAGAHASDSSTCRRRCELAEGLRLLHLVARQPSCWSVYREKAERLIAEAEAELPADRVAAIRTQAKQHELEQTARDVLGAAGVA